MAIIFHHHAIQRMEERGASEAEVQASIENGMVYPAEFGRWKCSLTFPFGSYWRGRFFKKKLIEAYWVEEGEDIIVVTVVVKYF